MESQPQNPEFRINPENFTHVTKALIRLCACAGWSVLVLFTTPGRQVFLPEAHII